MFGQAVLCALLCLATCGALSRERSHFGCSVASEYASDEMTQRIIKVTHELTKSIGQTGTLEPYEFVLLHKRIPAVCWRILAPAAHKHAAFNASAMPALILIILIMIVKS